MANYLSPGVYVEEIRIWAKPIQGVDTSTVGMVGLTQKGPINKPTLITSNIKFQNIFGGYLENSCGDYRYLPHAVEGFFQNGGQRLYINRVVASNNVVSDETIIGEYSKEPGKSTGLCAFNDIIGIKIIAVPNGTTKKIQNAMIAHCEQMNRFAVLDPKKSATVYDVQQQRSLFDSKYAALYFPWIKIKIHSTGEIFAVPPSGHICGIYVRTDVERGVQKAPANEAIKGVLSPEQQITKAQQDLLNPLGVNCLREFSGRGLRIWGDRTTSNDPLWKYINVRRLFLYLEESIEKGTHWAVFEPNNEKLWANINQTITNFLTTVWKNGALMGTTQEQAFFVKCDRTTMTQNDIDKGILIAIIGVAPTKPAEFVIFRIAQWQGGSTLTE
jgi:uncharacterized protein